MIHMYTDNFLVLNCIALHARSFLYETLQQSITIKILEVITAEHFSITISFKAHKKVNQRMTHTYEGPKLMC